MGFLLLETLGHGNAAVPGLLPESQVVGVDQVFDFLLDGLGMARNVILRKELFVLVIV